MTILAGREVASSALFQKALSLHQGGNLVGALQIYQRLLKQSPNHGELLFLAGTAECQRGNSAQGAELLARHLQIDPANVAAHSNRGNALLALGRLAEAIASYDKAIALKPDFVEAHYNRGNALRDLGRLAEAAASYDQAIALKPDYAAAHCNCGNVLLTLGRPAEAIASYDKAIHWKADYATAYYNRGDALRDLGRLEEAIASYGKAIDFRSDWAQPYRGRGLALHALKRFDAALASYDQAIEREPRYAEAFSCRGVTQRDLGRPAEALADHDRAIGLDPGNAEAHSNRGIALQDLGHHAEALAGYDRAIELKPGFVEAHFNRGNALRDLGRLKEAVASYRKAIGIEPGYVDAHDNCGSVLRDLERFDEALASYTSAIELDDDRDGTYFNRGICRLLLGNLEKGFEDYERRVTQGSMDPCVPKLTSLSDVPGRTILVHAEQGLGDTIQFCRYASMLRERGAKVLLAPQGRLGSLLRSLDGPAAIVGADAPSPRCDYHVSTMSLPFLFGTTMRSIPSTTPYLFADAGLVERWRRRIGDEGFRIGICWKGSAHYKEDARRSFPLELFSQLRRLDGVRLISLHKGEGEKDLERLPDGMVVETLGHDFDSGPDGFVDTAAVMKCLDLVVTSDTAIAHLAGALAVRTWVALCRVPDWRWLLERNDSPWYPTMRLFRQKDATGWEGVFEDIVAALRAHRASA